MRARPRTASFVPVPSSVKKYGEYGAGKGNSDLRRIHDRDHVTGSALRLWALPSSSPLGFYVPQTIRLVVPFIGLHRQSVQGPPLP